ncbi:MAG: HAD family hydrolase [Phycisphaerae bacterium]
MDDGKTIDALRPRVGVFLDRDGTIIEDTGFIGRPEDVRVLPGAIEGLRILQEMGYALIVVSNQSGLARGIFTLEQMEAVKERFCLMMKEAGVRLLDYFCCPHHVEGTVEEFRKDCADRKGSPGMILKGAYRHGLYLRGSWMIGDREDDIRAGRVCGMRTVQIKSLGLKAQLETELRSDFCADNLLAAVKILKSLQQTAYSGQVLKRGVHNGK